MTGFFFALAATAGFLACDVCKDEVAARLDAADAWAKPRLEKVEDEIFGEDWEGHDREPSFPFGADDLAQH